MENLREADCERDSALRGPLPAQHLSLAKQLLRELQRIHQSVDFFLGVI